MGTGELTALAARLTAARRAGATIDEAPAGLSMSDGYTVGARLSLGTPVGWKVGATSAGGQAALGIDEPLFGRVFAHGVFRDDMTALAFPGARPVAAEPEIIFEIGADGAINAAWFGVEVVRPSRDDAQALGGGFVVADNGAHVALLLGPPLPLGELDVPETLTARLLINGVEVTAGGAAAVLGDPRAMVGWLAGKLAGDSRGLQPGDLVSSGAMARAVEWPAGAGLRLDCGRFGTLEAAHAAGEVMPSHRD